MVGRPRSGPATEAWYDWVCLEIWGRRGRDDTHIRDHDSYVSNHGLKKGDGFFFYIDWVPDPEVDVTIREV